MRSVMDDLVCLCKRLPARYFSHSLVFSQGLSSEVVGTSSIFSGEEEIFAFARCCSRLVQMGSKEWAETAGVR